MNVGSSTGSVGEALSLVSVYRSTTVWHVSLVGDIWRFFTGAGNRMTSGVWRSVSSGLVTMLSLDTSSKDVSGSLILNCRKEKNVNNKRTSLSIDVIVSGVGRSINELIYVSPYCSSDNNYNYCFCF